MQQINFFSKEQEFLYIKLAAIRFIYGALEKDAGKQVPFAVSSNDDDFQLWGYEGTNNLNSQRRNEAKYFCELRGEGLDIAAYGTSMKEAFLYLLDGIKTVPIENFGRIAGNTWSKHKPKVWLVDLGERKNYY